MSITNSVKFNTSQKILYLLPSPSMRGGMTATTEMFYKAGVFDNKNIKHFNTSFKWSEIKLVRLFESVYLKLHFISVLLSFRPDAIFLISSPYWGYYDKIAYCMITRLFGIKSIFNSVSGGFVDFYEGSFFNRVLVKLTIRIPSAIALGTSHWMSYFEKEFGTKNLYEIANPVICDEFDRPKQNSRKEVITIISAFRITREKGVKELVEVIKEVCQQSDKFRFVILGEGTEYNWMKGELRELEKQNKVEIKGFITGEEKNNEIINANAYLMLTHFDMMPIAILEAMSASLPIISTKVGGIPDLIEEDVNGYLFEVNEVQKVVVKILSLWDKKDQLSIMGQNNKVKAREKYNIDKIVNKQIELVELITNREHKNITQASLQKNWYSYLVENLIFKIGDLILGTTFIKQLINARKQKHLTEFQLNELQNTKLKKILHHASQNSSYYKSIINNKIIDSEPENALKQLPILTKEILRSHLNEIITLDTDKLIPYETSGSSGKSTKVYLTNDEESICRAILINWWEWTGYYLGNPMLQTGMTTKRGLIKSIKDIATRTIYLDAFNLTDEEIKTYLKKIENTRNYYFGGYASSLYVIAQVADKYNINIQFKGVISWGDKMFPHYQTAIERVFQTKVYENYACNEGIMVGQKVDLPYFYIYTPNVYLELLDENGNEVPDGEIGRVIITKLDGYATPLIRYETGDLAIKLPRNEYPENRKYNFPLLKMVIGRDTDIIKTPEGNRLIVHTFTGIFEFYPSIKQFRVIQNVVDEIEIEYIKNTDFEASTLNNIEKDLRDKTKTNIKINWKEVDFIPNTKSGKPQLIQNNLIKKHNVE